MHLDQALALTAAFTKPDKFSVFCARLDRAWIEEALLSTGTATLRRRRLPAEQVVWLVLGMALMRDRPIVDVVRQLDLALPATGGRTVAPSAVPAARSRVGAEPLEWLFVRSADQWAHESAAADRWRGLALYGVDGTTVRVPDSDENRLHFGSQPAGAHGRGESGYPSVRLVALMALRSHLLAAASFGPYSVDERRYAEDLWHSVPDESLTLFDRNYMQANVFVPLTTGGKNRHWLTRAKKNNRWRVVEKLGDGDALVEMAVSSEARRKNPSLPASMLVRAIEYQHEGSEASTLLTSLVDGDKYPAAELVELYHERWEIELGYDEIKTELLDREEAIRSRSPAGVEQELWGTRARSQRLPAARVAGLLGVRPETISARETGKTGSGVDRVAWTVLASAVLEGGRGVRCDGARRCGVARPRVADDDTPALHDACGGGEGSPGRRVARHTGGPGGASASCGSALPRPSLKSPWRPLPSDRTSKGGATCRRRPAPPTVESTTPPGRNHSISVGR